MGFVIGLVSGFFIAAMAITEYYWHGAISPKEIFERGHMVQCVGKTGYYWECK